MSRKWESDDTKWFFEALCEHGKDFQAIQTYIACRSEKKKGSQKSANNETIKSREQVRHYYYRTWHKIASSLHFTEDIFQQTKELYGLINYGEIWKKFGPKFNSKIKMHLNELVFNGQTIAKIKGKNVKLKTPVCKALKKIHKVEDSKTSPSAVDISNLPKEIFIELHPANNSAWLRVHSVTQNPRLRIKLPLQKRLSPLISYLEKRWSETRLRALESETFTMESQSVVASNSDLRVRPHTTMLSDLKSLVIKRTPINFNSQVDLSLSAFIEKMYKNSETEVERKTKKSSSVSSSKSKTVEEPRAEESNCTQTNSSNAKCLPHSGDQRFCSTSDENVEMKSVPPIDETVRSLSLLKDMLASVDGNSSEVNDHEVSSSTETENEVDMNVTPDTNVCNSTCLPLPPPGEKIGEWLSASIPKSIEEESLNPKQDLKLLSNPPASDKVKELAQTMNIETVRKGWTASDGNITIGELYLMMERPKKILLEYEWVAATTVNKAIVDKMDARSVEHEEGSVLTRLMLAASLALMSVGKQEEANGNSLSPTKATKNTTRKNKRLKASSPVPPPVAGPANPNPSSEVLSTVISKTILNDNSSEKSIDLQINGEKSDNRENHPFVVPALPAPKCVKKPVKSRTVCGDRTMIEEAIRQLNSNRYQTRKHPRKSRPKPVLTPKPLLPRCPGMLNSLTGLPPPILNQVVSQTFTPSTLPGKQGCAPCPPEMAEHFQIPVVIPSTQHIVVNPANCHTVPVNVGQVLSAANQTLLSAVIRTPLSSSAVPLTQASCTTVKNNFLIKQATIPTVSGGTASDTIVISTATMKTVCPSHPPSLVEASTPTPPQPLHQQPPPTPPTPTPTPPPPPTSPSVEVTLSTPSTVLSKNLKRFSTSPPNIGCLLDMSLGENPLFGDNSCSSLSDAIGFNTVGKEDSGTSSGKASTFNDLVLPSSSSGQIPQERERDPLVSALVSTAKLETQQNSQLKVVSLPENWLNGDSSELSLGTLFSSNETPTKLEDTPSKGSAFMANVDMDTQMSLSTLVNDNSVDLVAKFADLADRINESELVKSETT